MESSHRFIKDCICTFSVDGVLEWDQLLPYAMAAFIDSPNEALFTTPESVFAAQIKIQKFGQRCDPPR